MGLLESALICIGLFLLFPKGFKYVVGSWVGAMSGGFLWGVVLASAFMLGLDPSWSTMGWTFLGFSAVGITSGCILAAHG